MYSTQLSSFISIPFPPSKSKTHKLKYPKILHTKLCNSTPKMSLNQNSNTNLINTITKLLWGPSLPPQLLISTVRSTWSATWQLMMSQLAPSDPTGSYTRPTSQFRLYSNPKLKFSPKDLHLYVGLPCPWAHRTLIVRALKGLEDSVPVSIASPGIDGSWEFRVFSDPDKDKLVPGLDKANGCKTLREAYKLRCGGYSGRSTVPMLWDMGKKEVLCNESYDIIEFFNSGLNEISGNPELDLSPPALKDDIRKWNDIIYPNVNNGVYRCGFAQSQEAYNKAAEGLFRTLEMLEDHLGGSRYLCGDVLTLADVCLFTTLIRFDVVYNVLFKCTKKKLIEFTNLHGYLRDIYQIPKVAETCNMGQIMEGYYKILFPLNPGGINPIMPSGCEDEVLSKPHNRDSLSLETKVVQHSVSSIQMQGHYTFWHRHVQLFVVFVLCIYLFVCTTIVYIELECTCCQHTTSSTRSLGGM